MGTVIITALITLLAIYAAFSTLKNKNYLGLIFSLATVGVFGFFTIMTILKSGFPEA
ncbi:DUF2759 domain-containing protein [Fervidibacillus halotolerans]|uniref:DUF2759 domain-containing protein n=1 Tax=Fervidibacillus halotolerans TaxID=2980027 RepID=A0A9E8LZ95_9BACI|nr:DUF2759 domain-containing protein [Fervidibacillus halotolerans]WAA11454.1 DUF2759 domain-containing protein [Fervidibacillus halotolerans]